MKIISEISGKVCKKQNVEMAVEIEVSAEDLVPGFYFLSVRSGEII